MDLYLDRLVQLRNEAANRMREIVTSAGDEKRDLTAEERTNLDAFNADYDRYAAEEKRILDVKNKIGPAADRVRERIEGALDASHRGVSAGAREGIVQAIIGFNNGDSRSLQGFQLSAEGGSRYIEARHSAGMLPLLYGDPNMRPKFFTNGEQRALTVASGTTVAQEFADFVVVYERTLNPIYDVATVLPTSNGEILTIPRLTADVSTGGTVIAEAGGVSEVDPTISAVNLSAYKFGATTIWSNELAQDNYINLDSLVAQSTARDLNIQVGSLFTTGSGSSQPKGFITAGTNLGTANGTASGGQPTDNFIGASDLLKAFYGLAAPYRRNAVWQASNTALQSIRTFRDKNGQFLWGTSAFAGQSDLFNGRPIYENPAMAALASASKSVAVGDFSAYYIRDVTPLRVDTSIHYKFSTDQFAVRTLARRDGNLIDTAAVGYIVSANT